MTDAIGYVLSIAACFVVDAIARIGRRNGVWLPEGETAP